jgi:hypothetical protein
MTNLTADDVRRLDALNLIEAISKGDQATAVNILVMYAEADRSDDPGASHRLADCLAFIAAVLLARVPYGDELLAAVRREMLGD